MKRSNPSHSIEVDKRKATGMKKAAGISAGTSLSEGSVSQECPAQRMKKDETYKRVMWIAAGSAMAANCEPCLNMVIPNLIEVGVPDAEIRRAVEIGQYVKDRKADIMKEAADILAGTSFLHKEVPEECTLDEMEFVRGDKMSMLIAVGAAVAGNCESCLNTVVPELKKAGATDEEIRGAVDIGLTVKERPAAIVKETADKLTGANLSAKPIFEEHPLEEKNRAACNCG
jgi:AhpD family alkylhydroperoxidase